MTTVSEKISSQTLLSINNSAAERLSTGSVDNYLITSLFLPFQSNCLFLPPGSSQKQRCRIAGLPKHHFQRLLPPTMDTTTVSGAIISRMGLRNETHINLKSFTAIFWSERISDLGLVTKPNSSLGNYILLTQSPSYSFSGIWVSLLILSCGLSQRQMHFGGEGDFCRSGHQNQLWVLEQTP